MIFWICSGVNFHVLKSTSLLITSVFSITGMFGIFGVVIIPRLTHSMKYLSQTNHHTTARAKVSLVILSEVMKSSEGFASFGTIY